MLKHSIKIALRNILKYWNYSIINIGGLAIGLASFIFIILYINDELKYDKFHEKADRIYRVNRLYNSNDVDEDAATVSFPCGPQIEIDYPGMVEKSVRFFNQFRNQWFFEYQKSEEDVLKFNEPYFILADSTVLDVFTFDLIAGDPETALDRPNTIIISASTAYKYFGDEPAIGKVLRVEEGIDFEVSGVFTDLPSQSHLKIDILGSLNTFKQFTGGQFPRTWIWNPCWTYVLLKEGVSPDDLDAKFPEFYENHYADLKNADVTLYLQSLTDIHLKSHHVYEMRANSDEIYVYILSIIAIIVLVLACINFMNLSTASSAGRAREIGMKKVFGGRRRNLATQFLGEAIVQSTIAMILAVSIVEILLPAFNNFTGKVIESGFIFDIKAILSVICLILMVGLFAGAYPAIFLSSFQPLKVLKGGLTKGAKSAKARKILVVVQFTISVSLIIGTMIVYAQLKYLRNAELGFNKEQIITFERNGQRLFQQYQTFKEELLSHKNIISVTGAEDLLGINHNTRSYEVEGLTEGQGFYIPAFMVDWDFVETFDIEVVEGRAFSKDFMTDTLNAVMINETMAKDLGWTNEEAIGKRVKSNDGEERVIGVFKDFNAMSLHRPIGKFILDIFRRPEVFSRFIYVKMNTENYSEVIDFLEEKWTEFNPNRPFQYNFLDTQLDQLYKDEDKFGKFSLLLTVLAIIIASMGLIGLTSFLAEQRTKEIGIRRALGASSGGIVSLMSKEFMWLLLISNIIAWPVTYFFTANWLENYSKHIAMNWWLYILSAIVSLAITMMIVGLRAYRTALLNPADTLRYE